MHIDINRSQATSMVRPEAPKGYGHASASKPLFREVQQQNTNLEPLFHRDELDVERKQPDTSAQEDSNGIGV